MPRIKKNHKIYVRRNGIKTNKKNKKSHNKKKHNITTKKIPTKVLPIVYGKLHMTGCIHCKMLAPEWDIVTEKMKIHNNVICHDIEQSEESIQLPLFNNKYKPYEPLQPQGGYPTIYKLHKNKKRTGHRYQTSWCTTLVT